MVCLKERRSAMDKYGVALTVEERLEVEQWVSAGKAAARRLTHARILLSADAWLGEADSLGARQPEHS
jgi:hypothetical protein